MSKKRFEKLSCKKNQSETGHDMTYPRGSLVRIKDFKTSRPKIKVSQFCEAHKPEDFAK